MTRDNPPGTRESESVPSTTSAIVLSNDPAIDGVRLIVLAPEAAWPYAPGQVAELSLGPGSEGYFAIASAPSEAPPIAFLVKAEGSPSEPLMRLEPGAEVKLAGP